MNTSFYVAKLTIGSVLLRLGLAVVLGGIIGIERERRGRAAGFRTYILVCLGATLAMMINQYLDYMQVEVWNPILRTVSRTDSSRLGAQVINGVGFLGAGTILVTKKQQVKGLTTAAGLWAAACMGLSIGAGFYACAITCLVLIFIIITVFPRIEYSIMHTARNINVFIEFNRYEDVGKVTDGIKKMGIKVFGVDVEKDSDIKSGRIGATFNLYMPKRTDHENVLIMLSSVGAVKSVSEV